MGLETSKDTVSSTDTFSFNREFLKNFSIDLPVIMSQHSPFLSLLPEDIVIDGILPHLSVRDLQSLDTAYSSKHQRLQLRNLWKMHTYPANDMLQMRDVEWLGSIGFVLHNAAFVQPKFSFANRRKTLRFFAAYLPALKHLRLAGNDSLYDIELVNLAEACPQLESLHLSHCMHMGDTGVKALAKNCHQLHTIHICGENNITGKAIQELCDNCSNLRHIDIARCSEVSDVTLYTIANNLPHLQSINIGGYFSDHAIEHFATKCHELISVSGCCGGEALAALWRANPSLEKFSCGHVLNDADAILLAQCCRKLQVINFQDHENNITDAGVVAIAEHCPYLISVNISSCDITDHSIVSLGQYCHELKTIDLSYDEITNAGIAALGKGCPLLQNIFMEGTNISAVGVVALANSCRDLHKVSMNNCKRIGFLAITTLVEKCPQLSELSLGWCKVNDASLHVIARCCCSLTCLDIQGSRRRHISHDALLAILTSCRLLTSVHGCDRLCRSDYEALQLEFSNVTFYASKYEPPLSL